MKVGDGRNLRLVLFFLGFVVSSSGVFWLTHRLLEISETHQPVLGMNMMPVLDHHLRRMPRVDGPWKVAFLGDSTVVSYPEKHRLYKRVREAANELGGNRPPIVVFPIAAIGMTPFDFYFLSGPIVRARPDQVLIPFNLAALSDPWRGRFVRPEFAAWLSATETVETIAQPLSYIGLTLDRILLYQLALRWVGFEKWQALRQHQTRMDQARLDLELAVSKWQKPNPVDVFRSRVWARSVSRLEIPKTRRYNEVGHETYFGDAYAGLDIDHPVIHIFRETLSRFQAAGIPAVVYIIPINTEHSKNLDLYDEVGLAKTLASIRRVSEESGAQFLDLHDFFPDEGFRDASGHFNHEGAIDGPTQLAREIAPELVMKARRTRGIAPVMDAIAE